MNLKLIFAHMFLIRTISSHLMLPLATQEQSVIATAMDKWETESWLCARSLIMELPHSPRLPTKCKLHRFVLFRNQRNRDSDKRTMPILLLKSDSYFGSLPVFTMYSY